MYIFHVIIFHEQKLSKYSKRMRVGKERLNTILIKI